MFRIMACVLGVIIAIAFPPCLFIVVPALVIFIDHAHKRTKEFKRQRQVFIDHMEQRERLKLLRSI